MVKMFWFLKRRPDMTPDEFHRYWRQQHGPLFCNTAVAQRYVVRYEQNHAAPASSVLGGDDFDGVSVMWFRSVDDIEAMYADPEFHSVLIPDGERFIDREATKRFVTLAEEPFQIHADVP
jgi:uncharacterized protein (TIGR02118 family)